MRISIIKKPFLWLFILLLLLPVYGIGCFGDTEQIPLSSTDSLSALLVPDANLELYVYAKQSRPTIIPAKFINLAHDIKVESLAIWGLPSDKGLVFGAGLTFTNDGDASEIYTGIDFDQNDWKILRNNKIYVVRGSGVAADSLKSSISSNSFTYYTNGSVLETVAMLPRGDRTKMVALAVAKPSKQVLDFASQYIGKKNYEQTSAVLRLINPEVVMGGLYSPHQINVAKAIEVFEKGSNITSLDLGMLVLVKSGLPGFLLEPAARNLLKDYGFTEARVGDFYIYKGLWSAPGGNLIPVLVRIDGNYIFASISAQEDYAQTLINSIYK
jgi:hypothetical protein